MQFSGEAKVTILRQVVKYAEPWEVSSAGKSVILGIGNHYMHDDAIGIEVAAELRKRSLGEYNSCV